MFIRLFAEAINKEEALKHSKNFESFISDSVIELKNTKIERYWKIPELYCIEFAFQGIIPERMIEAVKKLGNNPFVIADDGKIEEYIFSKTTGEIYLEKIEWVLIHIGE